jgi:hypothetical protein
MNLFPQTVPTNNLPSPLHSLLPHQRLHLITIMADPFKTQHQFYDAQYEAIGDLVDPGDDKIVDWSSLAAQVEQALSDPALPRYYRAEYHIINAWCSNPELQIQCARETIDDMVEVLKAEGRSQEEIDARLKTLQGMLEITEKRTKEKAER